MKRICVKPAAAEFAEPQAPIGALDCCRRWSTGLISDEVGVTEGQSVYVPLGVKHRLENPGKQLMVLIEVQIGTYLGKDDIIRYDDVYARD